MQTLIDVVLSFFNSFFGTLFKWGIDRIREFWKTAGTWVVGAIMYPLAWFIYGPFYKLALYVYTKILDLIVQNFPMDGPVMQVTGFASWLLYCFKITECFSIIMSYLAFSLLLAVIKKVF